MKLRFKHQKFQEDAVKATCDVFTGQPNIKHQFLTDQGDISNTLLAQTEQIGYGNTELYLQDAQLIKNLHEIQSIQNIPQNNQIERLNNRPVFTIEMETGTGKTYTYIKTMYELNKQYGWCKFIIVVPSIAIREGVYKSFQTTADHFAEDYGEKIRFFIYNSSKLNELEQFADSPNINAMIINTQAFNSRGAESKRIRMKLDSFRSRKPIDVVAATRPIVIVDEPQSVLGTDKNSNITRETIADFNPLFYLNYSATHREDFNKIYRLDAVDAYQRQLVKKITVKGITIKGGTTTNGYLYLQKINTYPNRKPTATVVFEFDAKDKGGIRRKTKTLVLGDDIYVHSGELEEYRNGYRISEINAREEEGFVDFVNGIRIHEGEVIGQTNEDDIRRIQIRETIMSHLETERRLFNKGIKVLSLFFIDEVAKYKYYDEDGEKKGPYAKIFEEEFAKAVDIYLNQQLQFEEESAFRKYLEKFTPSEIHSGYFSIDKKTKRAVNTKEGDSKDSVPYELIMKDKERLLSFEEPVRFIFSHSALREGWDNPNVFQICTLRESDATIKKRQEIGRGLRLCVDQNGIRQDAETLGENLVHDTNILTVIANESYETFASNLQNEFDEIIAKRPKDASASLFNGKTIRDDSGAKPIVIDDIIAGDIFAGLVKAELVDIQTKQLTETYRTLSDDQKVQAIREAVLDIYAPYAENIKNILATVYDANAERMITNARRSEKLNLNQEKYASAKFRELWNHINDKTCYTVEFDEQELINRCIDALNKNLRVTKTEIVITEGVLKTLGRDKVEMYKDKIGKPIPISEITADNVEYDLLSELAKSQSDGGTSLTRKAIAEILGRINPDIFAQFKTNPEEFIHNTIQLINGQKASTVVEHIEYNKMNEKWDGGEIFINNDILGDYSRNLIDTPNHHLYDKLRYDSNVEKDFAEELDKNEMVEIFVKLPKQFYIDTPMGHYNPDWAIAFHDDVGVKHIYFVAETKGVSEGQLDVGVKGIEKAKIECAKKHFAKISNGDCIYGVCNSYSELLKLVQ
ncbi:DEAD/DEAH box helicase family protein [Candidatus Saccharibacteria bacterium]|nr:DEAD/DEAH box helicase family protein [Candidatus Saccharibacteria bacterium]